MKFAQGAFFATVFSGICAAAAYAQGTTSLGAASGPEAWVQVHTGQAGAGYVAAQPILRKDSYAVIWHLQNFADARAVGGKTYRSMKTQVEYNCAARESRAVYAEMYAGAMATGRLVDLSYDEGGWRQVPAAAGGFRLACSQAPQPAVLASAP
ncbi:surface-adhesin E family protein [Acidisoma sp. C75]